MSSGKYNPVKVKNVIYPQNISTGNEMNNNSDRQQYVDGQPAGGTNYALPSEGASISASSTYPSTTNVALTGTATQSSDCCGGVASRAIDGNTSGVWGNNSVTHTSGSAPGDWWQVSFATTFVKSITLWNRTDCCQNRLRNFRVSVYNGATEVYGFDYGTTIITSSYTLSNVNTIGDRVRITLNNGNTPLSLAEVQVITDSFGPYEAIDGELEDGTTQDHYWIAPNATLANLTVDMGQTRSIGEIKVVNCRNSTYQDSSTRNYRLGISTDNSNYTIVRTGTLTQNDITTYVSTTFAATSARYVRFYMDSYYGTRGGLSEIEIYGAASSVVKLPDVSTLDNGHTVMISNTTTQSSGVVTINTFSDDTKQLLTQDQWAYLTCLNNAGGNGVSSWLSRVQPVISGYRYLRFYADNGFGNNLVALSQFEAYNASQYLNVTATSGVIQIGSLITGGGMSSPYLLDYFIDSQVSGTAGGVGVYRMNKYFNTNHTPTTCNSGNLVQPALSSWSKTGITSGTTHITGQGNSSAWLNLGYIVSTPSSASYRTADYTAIAPWTGSVQIDYMYYAEHSFFQDRYVIQTIGNTVTTILDDTDFDTQGRDASGTVTIQVTSGQPFGFRLGGSHSDGTGEMAATLNIFNFVTPTSAPSFSITSEITGGGFVNYATAAQGATVIAGPSADPFGTRNRSINGNIEFEVVGVTFGWFGANGARYLTYDLGQLRPVGEIRVANANHDRLYFGTQDYRIGVSQDGTNFTIIHSGTLEQYVQRKYQNIPV